MNGRGQPTEHLPNRPTVVLLVRHGKTPTTGKVLPGRAAGLHLSEEGRAQAEAVAERIAALAGLDSGRGPVAVYASPLERTAETAKPIARKLGLRVRTERGPARVRLRAVDRRPAEALAKKPEWTQVQRWPSGFRFPGGESFLEMQARITSAISRLVRAAPGGDGRGRVPRRPDQGGGGHGGRHPPRSLPAPHRRPLLGVGRGLQPTAGPHVLTVNSTGIPRELAIA